MDELIDLLYANFTDQIGGSFSRNVKGLFTYIPITWGEEITSMDLIDIFPIYDVSVDNNRFFICYHFIERFLENVTRDQSIFCKDNIRKALTNG